MLDKYKATYGTSIEKRAKLLLEALLAYMNCRLEDINDISLTYKLQNETTEQPKLVIETKLRVVESLGQKGRHEEKLATDQIRQELNSQLKDFLQILEDNCAKTKGKEDWNFILKVSSKGQEGNLDKIAIEGENKQSEKTEQKETLQETVVETFQATSISKNEQSNRTELCQSNLLLHEEFTYTFPTRFDRVTPTLNEVYVPVGIVKHKLPEPPLKNQQEKNEEEKLIFITEERFFVDVRGESDISQGRRIAIVGEPGSGKTTRLQKIADWILEEDLGLPIWISLADLTQPSVTQYIEEIWLKQTNKHLTLDELIQQKDRIWLLLDGLDEMTSRVEARHVSVLLEGWVQAARVVVTCRVNVWEADQNPWSGFDVFRNLEFSPEQVKSYICHWFAAIGDAIKGEALEVALTQSENVYLKELIQNPLRLWMFCQIWQTSDSFPKTQAELYEQFVDLVFYSKADETVLEQREVIDQALVQLALAAMEHQEGASRFRLRESWMLQVLGSRRIFEAVKKLGWLNPVGVDNQGQPIFAFYHSTFQEYFAALAVKDWDYFLPRNHVDFPVEGKEYRIFEPQWKQVILLWLGRGDITDKEKEGFIEKLVNFHDGCGEWNFKKVDRGLYKYRAYFLAAAAINEFKDFSLSSEIVQQIVEWGLSLCNVENYEWQTFLNPIKEGARKAILETIREFAIAELIQVIKSCKNKDIFRRVAESFGEIGKGHPEAISAFIHVLETTDDQKKRQWAAETLKNISQGNSQSISNLIRILETTNNEEVRRQTAEILGKIGKRNPKAISDLIRILKTTNNEEIRKQTTEVLGEVGQESSEAISALIKIIAMNDDKEICRKVAYSLRKIGKGNLHVISAFIRVLATTNDEEIRREVTYSLQEIGEGNSQVISAFIQILETTDDEKNRRQAAYSLREVGKGNPQASLDLIRILETTNNEEILLWAAFSLGEIDPGNPQVIPTFIRILKWTQNDSILRQAAMSLEAIDPGNPETISALLRILEISDDEDNLRWMASSLGEIGQGNPQALSALIRVLDTADYRATHRRTAYNLRRNRDVYKRVAESLGKIGQGHPEAISALIKILETTDDEYIRWRIAESLGEIGKGNSQAISALIRILEATDDRYSHWQAAYSLRKIGKGNSQAISDLIRIMETTNDREIRKNAAESLGVIGQGNLQAISALIRIIETTDNESVREHAAYSLEKIDPGNPQAISVLIRVLETTDDEDFLWLTAHSLWEIDPRDSQVITAFIRILETTDKEYTYWSTVESLEEIGQVNPQVVADLIRVLKTTENSIISWWVAYSLRKISNTPEQYADVILALKNCLNDEFYQNNFDRFNQCYEVVWDCAENLSYPDFYRAWHGSTESQPDGSMVKA